MRLLCRLEVKKIQLSAYLWAVLGIFAGLLAFGVLSVFMFKIEGAEPGASQDLSLFADWNGLLSLTTALAFASFSILSAVIGARVIVADYIGKNAVVLLSYPLKRGAVFQAKCLLVCGITTAFSLASNITVTGTMFAVAHIFKITPQMDAAHFPLTVLVSSLLMGVLASTAGIISTALGWWKRSVIAAVISSLIIACVLTNFITVSPQHIVWVLLAISTVLVVIANVIYHILAKVIEKMEV